MPKRLRIIGLPEEVHPVAEILKQNGYIVCLDALRRDQDEDVISYELKPIKKSEKPESESDNRAGKAAKT